MVESSQPGGGEEEWDEDDWGLDGEGGDEYLTEEMGYDRKASAIEGVFAAQKVFQAGHSKNLHYTLIDKSEIHIV